MDNKSNDMSRLSDTFYNPKPLTYDQYVQHKNPSDANLWYLKDLS